MAYKRGIDPEVAFAHLKSREQWFQCDRCGFNWPESRVVEQDGFRLCRDNCAYPIGRQDKDRIAIEEETRAIALEANAKQPKYPFAYEMKGVSALTGIVPRPVSLIRGGASVPVALTGVNLSSADVITYSSLSVENAVAPAFAVDGITGTLTVRAPIGATPGDYDLTFSENLFRGVFQVRG